MPGRAGGNTVMTLAILPPLKAAFTWLVKCPYASSTELQVRASWICNVRQKCRPMHRFECRQAILAPNDNSLNVCV